jgi:hypothetical protein
MGKIIKFQPSEKILLKQAMKEAKREFELLYKLTGGHPDLAPEWLLGMDKETYKKWEDGDIEI